MTDPVSPQPTPADALETAWRKFKRNGTDERRGALGVAIANAVTHLRQAAPILNDACPMGCGRTTEDAAGGPCSKCWEKV